MTAAGFCERRAVQEMNDTRDDNPTASQVRICIIDDDPVVIRTAERLLRSNGYRTIGISEVIGSSAVINAFKPQLIVLDQNMPALNGELLYHLFKRTLKTMPRVILFSGMPPEQLERLALSMNVDDFVYKGDGFLKLLNKVNLAARELSSGEKSTRDETKKREGNDDEGI